MAHVPTLGRMGVKPNAGRRCRQPKADGTFCQAYACKDDPDCVGHRKARRAKGIQ